MQPKLLGNLNCAHAAIEKSAYFIRARKQIGALATKASILQGFHDFGPAHFQRRRNLACGVFLQPQLRHFFNARMRFARIDADGDAAKQLLHSSHSNA